MRDDPVVTFPDSFPSSFFYLGTIEIRPAELRRLFTDDELVAALKRHAGCDFGQVPWEQHCGNLANIAEHCGWVESLYSSSDKPLLRIGTSMDEFKPRTLISAGYG